MVNDATCEASLTLPRVLGLDISTSVTGMTVLDAPFFGLHVPNVVVMTHVELARIDGFWAKVDEFKRALYKLTLGTGFHGITHIFVEESLQAFRPGLSSAATLMTLAKFNGIVSSIIRDEFGRTPVPLSATSARKSCGIKVSRDAHGPDGKKLGAKQQTFIQMTGPDGFLAGHEFPTKRGGAPKDWAYDEVDSAVIAWAGLRSLS